MVWRDDKATPLRLTSLDIDGPAIYARVMTRCWLGWAVSLPLSFLLRLLFVCIFSLCLCLPVSSASAGSRSRERRVLHQRLLLRRERGAAREALIFFLQLLVGAFECVLFGHEMVILGL